MGSGVSDELERRRGTIVDRFVKGIQREGSLIAEEERMRDERRGRDLLSVNKSHN